MASEHTPIDEGLSIPRDYLELSSQEPSAESSATPSRPTSAGGILPHKKSRVRFNSTNEANDTTNQKSKVPLRDDASSVPNITVPRNTKISPSHSKNNSITNLSRRSLEREIENPFANPFLDPASAPAPNPPSDPFSNPFMNPAAKPRPSLLRNNSATLMNETDDVDEFNEKTFSALAAQERAQRIASSVVSHSRPSSRRNSLDDLDEEDDDPPHLPYGLPVRIDDIPLVDMDSRNMYDGAALDDSDDEHDLEKPSGTAKKLSSKGEAHKLVRAHTRKWYPSQPVPTVAGPSSGVVTGPTTPENQQREEGYVPKPQQYRGGVLSSLLKLYNAPSGGSQSRRGSGGSTGSPSHSGTQSASAVSSGRTTPKNKGPKWYNHRNQSQDTLAGLVEASAMLGAAGGATTPKKPVRPGMGKRAHSNSFIDTAKQRLSKPRLEDEIRITVHIAETLSRQRYLKKLCWALMSYGAPSHRLEEYLKMSARVLEIDGQFLYLPGCMIISFDDSTTHTTEVKIVKATQGVDLGKLKDVHEIYKEVAHDLIGVEEALQRLKQIKDKKQKYNKWAQVVLYGLASAFVGPFAFSARPIDMPLTFFLGSILGALQLLLAPKLTLYNAVSDISAAVITSFLARAFGSVRGGELFCFSAMAQSSIALILPGYAVLCGALELQSKNIIAGSVRMVYAVIYSLFLGYGITVGTAMYGLMDPNATSSTTCANNLPEYWKWAFVPPFTLCLCIINQAKWKQTPVMLAISFVGYVVNFFAARKFSSSAQMASTFGALAVGLLGNLYSRMYHGVAAAALLPAIFVQVPSGLAAGGSLLAGLSSADQITNTTTFANGTAKINGTSTITFVSGVSNDSVVFNVGYNMIQIAIGITVGLFLSALLVYPFGKRRSGLFSF